MNFSFQVDQEIELILPVPGHAAELSSVVRANLTHLQKWVPWATEDYSVESARVYIKNNLQEIAAGTGFSASIVYENKICGQIGLHNLNPTNKSVQMGYWIAAESQGKGIVTQCARVFIDYAFDDLNLNRVQINCNVENTKSRQIPERLGFKLEGIHRQVEWMNNRIGDWAIYAILKQDWKINEWL